MADLLGLRYVPPERRGLHAQMDIRVPCRTSSSRRPLVARSGGARGRRNAGGATAADLHLIAGNCATKDHLCPSVQTHEEWSASTMQASKRVTSECSSFERSRERLLHSRALALARAGVGTIVMIEAQRASPALVAIRGTTTSRRRSAAGRDDEDGSRDHSSPRTITTLRTPAYSPHGRASSATSTATITSAHKKLLAEQRIAWQGDKYPVLLTGTRRAPTVVMGRARYAALPMGASTTLSFRSTTVRRVPHPKIFARENALLQLSQVADKTQLPAHATTISPRS